MKTLLSMLSMSILVSLTPACLVAPEGEDPVEDVEEEWLDEEGAEQVARIESAEEDAEKQILFPQGEAQRRSFTQSLGAEEKPDLELPPIVLQPRPRPGIPVLGGVSELPEIPAGGFVGR
jgi:hypothetical protein